MGSLAFRRTGARPLWLELSEEAEKAGGGHIAQGCGCSYFIDFGLDPVESH